MNTKEDTMTDPKPFTEMELDKARDYYVKYNSNYLEGLPKKTAADMANNQRRWLATLDAKALEYEAAARLSERLLLERNDARMMLAAMGESRARAIMQMQSEIDTLRDLLRDMRIDLSWHEGATSAWAHSWEKRIDTALGEDESTSSPPCAKCGGTGIMQLLDCNDESMRYACDCVREEDPDAE